MAHPGEVHTAAEKRREINAHKAAQVKARRSLANCANSASAVALKARSVARRAATAQALREKRSTSNKSIRSKRDQTALESWAAVSHNVTSEGYTLDTPMSTLFDSNSTCALVPETTIGPYFVAGELIRADITDGYAGVPLHLDIQFVDIATCGAVPNMLIDIWHCNAVGVYSGVSASGQGGLNSTFGRGVQPTDDDGVAQFDTMFPGHYTGRATHIHVMSSENASVLANNTYQAGVQSHIGQLFFDQDLISAVELTSAYTSNQQVLTTNLEDGIAAGEATTEYDPFMDYVVLGDAPEHGILAFITVGVDTTANYTSEAIPAAYYREGGGVDSGLIAGPPGGGDI